MRRPPPPDPDPESRLPAWWLRRLSEPRWLLPLAERRTPGPIESASEMVGSRGEGSKAPSACFAKRRPTAAKRHKFVTIMAASRKKRYSRWPSSRLFGTQPAHAELRPAAASDPNAVQSKLILWQTERMCGGT